MPLQSYIRGRAVCTSNLDGHRFILVDLRCLRFCQSYIGCPEHFNPLQQFVLLRNVLGGTAGASDHFSIDVLLLTHDATPARGNGWPSESRGEGDCNAESTQYLTGADRSKLWSEQVVCSCVPSMV